MPALDDITLYEVEDDGTVLIDWAEVEALLVLTPQAQVMLATRDGKRKAMDHEHD